ncbi:MAG: alpha/beta hydrolase fold domain-containing protein [Saccharofermentans sp.]|nr:alpha/beta hydrolase fold domain-containing protein [Saccharofermentans sp.]
MSLKEKMIRSGLRMGNVKNLYSVPETEFVIEIKKRNSKRTFEIPDERGYDYEEIPVLEKYRALVCRKGETPSERAVLYIFGGDFLQGREDTDLDILHRLAQETGLDIWFPFYPLCIERTALRAYDMVLDTYRQMVRRYGEGNVSVVGSSSGGTLAVGIPLYINYLKNAGNDTDADPRAELPTPRRIICVSPLEIPWNDEEKNAMALVSYKDDVIDYAIFDILEKYMMHGRDIPDFMLHPTRGDFTGMNDLTIYYSSTEVFGGAAPYFRQACDKYQVPCRIDIADDMLHNYAMMPYFSEGKAKFDEIVRLLGK